MKTLILVRHAKAEKSEGNTEDIDRQLTEKAVIKAKWVAQVLKQKKISPDLVISSPARRCMRTAGIFCEAVNYPAGKIQVNDTLYQKFELITYIRLIENIDHKINTVMVVGHKETIQGLNHHLNPEFEGNIKKGGVVSIIFNVVNWSEIRANLGKLDFYEMPSLFSSNLHQNND